MLRPDLLNILVIDDDQSMRHMLRLVLEREHYRITEAKSAEQAINLLEKEIFDALLCDIRMPGMNGLELLNQPQIKASDAVIIMMSAYGSIDNAIECMKRGAYDYISKPFKPDEVLLTLKKAEERRKLEFENQRLRKDLAQHNLQDYSHEIIHSSTAMQKVLNQVRMVANSDASVLITGETGTGKELIARALHHLSPRATDPFLAINCSAISSGLLESELFGHVRGAFTGADRKHNGLFSAANGGTLFLDEISEMPLELQPKLLRVLQENEIRPVGSSQNIKINTRVIAACGTSLRDKIENNSFREDLFYRLAVVDLTVPPLRERPEDIEVLSRHFLEEIAHREGLPTPPLSSENLTLLQGYHWPGNVRELKNFIEKAFIFSKPGELSLSELPAERRNYTRLQNEEFSLKKITKRIEKEYIRKALHRTSGNRTQAASLLEISLRSLMYKIKEYEFD